MREINGYLSQRAQANFGAKALVWGDEVAGEAEREYVLERPGKEPVLLGVGFQKAMLGLSALIRAKEPEAKVVSLRDLFGS